MSVAEPHLRAVHGEATCFLGSCLGRVACVQLLLLLNDKVDDGDVFHGLRTGAATRGFGIHGRRNRDGGDE